MALCFGSTRTMSSPSTERSKVAENTRDSHGYNTGVCKDWGNEGRGSGVFFYMPCGTVGCVAL